MLASGNLREEKEKKEEEEVGVVHHHHHHQHVAPESHVPETKKAKMPAARDWSSLLPELLSQISRKLPEISDHIRFRSVCSKWHAISIPTTALFRFPRFPCYFAYYHLFRHPPSSHCHLLTHNKLHTLRLPYDSTDRHSFFGSAFGYLVIINLRHSAILLVNPFTRSEIQLPPLTFRRGRIGCVANCKAKLVKSEHGFSVIVAHETEEGHLTVVACRSGDSAFTVMHRSVGKPLRFSDFILHDGKLVLLGDDFTTCIIDLTDPMHRKFIPKAMTSNVYDVVNRLVESSSGELLMVSDIGHGCRRFQVLRLDKGEKPRWSKITNIGDDVLFHDDANVMCFAASGLDECRGNCIYFWDRTRVGLFDIGAGEVAELPDSWGKFPILWANRGVWILPSL